MARPLAVALAAVLVALPAGCGEDDAEKFRDAYDPVNEKLTNLGQEVSDALQAAQNKSDKELADQFGSFSEDLADISDDVDGLDPPDEVENDVDKLKGAIDDVEESLQDIADASRRNDSDDARTATLDLIQRGENLDRLQRRVASEAADA